MNEYPEIDYPYTLYFQGIAMPKWSNCWQFQSLSEGDIEWPLDQVHACIDHCGQIESEERDYFLIAAQQMLLAMIDGRDEFMTDSDQFSVADCQVIYAALIEGLQQMIMIAEREQVVFWIGGYEQDRERLVEAIRRFHLGEQHPDYFVPPHRLRRQRERLFTLNAQRKDLRRRLATIGPHKSLKRFIHELKDRPDLGSAQHLP